MQSTRWALSEGFAKIWSIDRSSCEKCGFSDAIRRKPEESNRASRDLDMMEANQRNFRLSPTDMAGQGAPPQVHATSDNETARPVGRYLTSHRGRSTTAGSLVIGGAAPRVSSGQ